MRSNYNQYALIGAVACFTGWTALAAAPALTFDLSDSFITVGESFTIGVKAQENASAGDLTAFGFDVDSGLVNLTFNSYAIGSDYTDIGSGNEVEGLYNGTGNAGQNVLLATLAFTATAPGVDSLDLTGLFDGLFKGGYYEFANDDILGSLAITVHESNGLPDAGATLLLLATGCLALRAARSRRE